MNKTNHPDLESKINDVRAALSIAMEPIENAIGRTVSQESEAAAYALYNLQREVEKLHDVFHQ